MHKLRNIWHSEPQENYANPTSRPHPPPLSFPQSLSGNPYWIMLALIRLTQTGFPLIKPALAGCKQGTAGMTRTRVTGLRDVARCPIWASVPFTDYHKHLLFCDLLLSTATGSTTTGPTGWSTPTPKYPSFPFATLPDTISHSPAARLDSRLKTAGMTTGECGNAVNLYKAWIQVTKKDKMTKL